MSDSTRIGWRFLASKRWLGYYAMLVVFAIACVLLGNWQFERRDQARSEISRIDANYDTPPVPIEQALPSPDAFDEDAHKWLQVSLRGAYIDDPVLARNRPAAGAVGSNLVQAFQLTDGSIFFVDRGWVPVMGELSASDVLPGPPSGEVSVTVRLRESEPQIDGRTATDTSVPSIHVDTLAEHYRDRTVYSGAYGQLVAEEPSGETGRLTPRPERDEGPHLSYALQWYVFILIALIGVGYAARQEYRTLNAGDASVQREDERRAARKRRKGPTDAEEEDALIDG